MITKKSSSKRQLIKYMLIIPFITIFSLSYALVKDQQGNSSQIPDSTSLSEVPTIIPIDVENLKSERGWGERIHPITKKTQFHKGVDFSANIGTSIKATASGKIIKAEEDINYGKYIVISHGKTFQTLYAHMSELKVKSGDVVERGQVIGLVGITGKSTGPHLHYEVLLNGKNVNPEDYYRIK